VASAHGSGHSSGHASEYGSRYAERLPASGSVCSPGARFGAPLPLPGQGTGVKSRDAMCVGRGLGAAYGSTRVFLTLL
jgi:hypothetical protein